MYTQFQRPVLAAALHMRFTRPTRPPFWIFPPQRASTHGTIAPFQKGGAMSRQIKGAQRSGVVRHTRAVILHLSQPAGWSMPRQCQPDYALAYHNVGAKTMHPRSWS